MSVAVEIAVEDVAGLVVAAQSGAARVELCADLSRGGLTPDAALVAECAQAAARLVEEREAKPGFGVHVLVRSRASAGEGLTGEGEFVYSPEEIDLMAQQAARSVRAGAAGVVIGALTPQGAVDAPAVGAIRDAALEAATAQLRSLTLTFHRALDAMPTDADRTAAMEQLMLLGFHRVLSSGGAQRAIDGADCLAQMVRAADELIDVCAGGGIRPAHIRDLVQTAGVEDIHLSARRRTPLAPGESDPETRTDTAVVQAAVDAAGEL